MAGVLGTTVLRPARVAIQVGQDLFADCTIDVIVVTRVDTRRTVA